MEAALRCQNGEPRCPRPTTTIDLLTVGRVPMGRFSPGAPVTPAPTRARHTRAPPRVSRCIQHNCQCKPREIAPPPHQVEAFALFVIPALRRGYLAEASTRVDAGDTSVVAHRRYQTNRDSRAARRNDGILPNRIGNVNTPRSRAASGVVRPILYHLWHREAREKRRATSCRGNVGCSYSLRGCWPASRCSQCSLPTSSPTRASAPTSLRDSPIPTCPDRISSPSRTWARRSAMSPTVPGAHNMAPTSPPAVTRAATLRRAASPPRHLIPPTAATRPPRWSRCRSSSMATFSASSM